MELLDNATFWGIYELFYNTPNMALAVFELETDLDCRLEKYEAQASFYADQALCMYLGALPGEVGFD